MSRIVTRDEDSVNLDIDIKNKWNRSWLEKKCRCQKVVPSKTWKGDPIISLCVGESIRKVNLRKQTHSMSVSNDVRNKNITKVQWRIQTTVAFVLRFVWISIWLLNHLILLEILHLVEILQSKYVLIIWLKVH